MREPVANHRRRSGQDKFGRFTITGGPCTHCGQGGQYCVKYVPKDFALPDEVDVAYTILKMPDEGYLGISCGCYSKLHRQVTLIVANREARRRKK